MGAEVSFSTCSCSPLRAFCFHTSTFVYMHVCELDCLMLGANQLHLRFVTAFLVAADAFVFHFSGLEGVPAERRSVHQSAAFPNRPASAAANGGTSKAQRSKFSLLVFCLFVTAFPQDTASCAGPERPTPVGKIPVTSVRFGFRPFWPERKDRFRQRLKGEENAPLSMRAVRKPHEDLFENRELVSLADVVSKGRVF